MTSLRSRLAVATLLAVAGHASAQCADPLAVVRATDPAASDRFGAAVSLHPGSGVTTVAMVGAIEKDISGVLNAGKVYSYGKFGPTTWGLLTVVEPNLPNPAELFGAAIASSNSVLLVGAPGSSSFAGSVYVFRRPGIDWEQIQQLAAPFPSGNFGAAIAMDGNRAVIAAPKLNLTAPGVNTLWGGQAYMYERNTTTGQWTRTDTFQEPIVAWRNDLDFFGQSVALAGDHAAFGIPGRNAPGGQSEAGAVRTAYYDAGSGNWINGPIINNPNPADFARFGTVVRMSGVWMAIASPADDVAANNAGAVHMYKRTGNTWALVQTVRAFPPVSGDEFGTEVALEGDNLIVSSAASKRKIYQFRRSGDSWQQQKLIPGPTGATSFATALAISGTDVLAANEQASFSGFTGAGEAYAFSTGSPQADMCEDALPVGYGTFTACTTAATLDGVNAAPCIAPALSSAPDVWWAFTAPASGLVEVTTEGSGWDTVLSIHTGCPATAANAIACNDDISATIRQSKITFVATAGATYRIRGSGYNGASGGMVLKISASAACYANCDGSTTTPVLNALDFGCFLTRYQQGQPYANCDGSTATPALNALDFSCFLTKYRAGCE